MHIGLDVGTSGTKAALIDLEGNVIDSYRVDYNFAEVCGGKRELDANEVWKAAMKCIHETGAGKYVATITVSSLGEAIVPISESGEPLGNSITGTDIRGRIELSEMLSIFGEEKITDITGLNISSIYSALKILWLRKHQPDIYHSCWKIMTIQDYIIYRLCREAQIDYACASRTMLFDVNVMRWSETIMDRLNILESKLSMAVPAGTTAGIIDSVTAEELGLDYDVKIVTGSHDHICNAIGSGVCSPGECVNTVGTTEGITAVVKREQLTIANIVKYHIACEPFIKEGLYNTVAWQNTSGALLRWFAHIVKEPDNNDLIKVYNDLNKRLPKMPTTLLVLPHFSGAATPYTDEASKGGILGLSLETTKEDIYKALMEGINYELALILECIMFSGLKVDSLVATGGALSPELLQIKADILGLEVQTLPHKQSGVIGGAMLGAVAAGDYNNIDEAVKRMVRKGLSYYPDSRRKKLYEEKKELYKGLYKTLKELNHSL